jgi:hypothetical protein
MNLIESITFTCTSISLFHCSVAKSFFFLLSEIYFLLFRRHSSEQHRNSQLITLTFVFIFFVAFQSFSHNNHCSTLDFQTLSIKYFFSSTFFLKFLKKILQNCLKSFALANQGLWPQQKQQIRQCFHLGHPPAARESIGDLNAPEVTSGQMLRAMMAYIWPKDDAFIKTR